MNKSDYFFSSDKSLFSRVTINPHYQRSINLKHDFGNQISFQGFICHNSATVAIETLSNLISKTNQRAFTLTGPYGSGKSTLLNLIGSSICRDLSVRESARDKFNPQALNFIEEAFPIKQKGWTVLNIIGNRTNPLNQIFDALSELSNSTLLSSSIEIPTNKKQYSIDLFFEWLKKESQSKDSDGVLIIIDEMGKFLEAAIQGEGDIYFFQLLAENITRSQGDIILIGSLHQAISAYGNENLDEWRKVQGRFSDIPLFNKTDEVVELVGNAIYDKSPPKQILDLSKNIFKILSKQKPQLRGDYSDILVKCSPFHPVMACLLGPVSRKQYGQNERSIFSFLSIPDPFSFSDFLQSKSYDSTELYTPSIFWDYLRSNLEPAISSSTDSHRWATAIESVERAESKFDTFKVSIVKNIAVLDLLKKTSGIQPSLEVLESLYPNLDESVLKESLNILCDKKIITFRRHLEAYAVFEGSDFDIDVATSESRKKFDRADLEVISKIFNTNPIVAKRHYFEKGTLRWLNTKLVFIDDLFNKKRELKRDGGFGELLVVLPSITNSIPYISEEKLLKAISSIKHPVIAFSPLNSAKINTLALDLMALQDVQTRAQELHGDSVARREVASRITSIAEKLEASLNQAFLKAKWVSNRKINSNSLSEISSELASLEFNKTPIIINELVNRNNISSNAAKARRLLLYSIEKNSHIENLGINGFPAERGIYESILKNKAHVNNKNIWGFKFPPIDSDVLQLNNLYTEVLTVLGDGSSVVSVSDIFDIWSAPPYGIRSGVLPILLHVILKAKHSEIAIYRDGVFCTEFKEAYIDEFLAKPKRFGIRSISKFNDSYFLEKRFKKALSNLNEFTELSVARELVKKVLSLPKLTQQTEKLSLRTRQIRDCIKNANDPHDLINFKLPEIIKADSNEKFSDVIYEAINEMDSSFHELLKAIEFELFRLFDVRAGDFEKLKERSQKLLNKTGEFKLESFVLRLFQWSGDNASTEGILSIAITKPSSQWRDQDIQFALITIRDWVTQLRKIETLGDAQTKSERESFLLLVGAAGREKLYKKEFTLLENEIKNIEKMTYEIKFELIEKLKKNGFGKDKLLPLISNLGKLVFETEELNNEN